ncbi:hydroxymethylglutaryl-CoA reductase [Microbacterium sp. AISO3]|jgi:hydroxymethylglutaryl-CoA reductase (NADPH)|uniref:hydroxymethylglutaryl-CoA reductase n=1 Tax=Microbacterium sp. AISO3 TaxID=2002831 RepID=UPI000B4C6714|nr:hydroxymethylglutaryl-CoA reductase [Microbacterium sp. AISO3]OWP22992.1 hydroxymethylglutaryl-CoA reductase [Microbacterium sp. AISO3]
MSAEFTPIPLRWVGPLRLTGDVEAEQEVPLATYESPLWPSVGRGARISRLVDDGIRVTVVDERMTRSSLFVADTAAAAVAASRAIIARFDELAAAVSERSRHAKLIDLDTEVVGNLLYLRFALTTGDASGHNMVTFAAETLMERVLSWHPELSYGSISGNYCTDKKATAVNGILGRGRNVIAEILIPADLVEKQLRSSAQRIVDLNVQKNLVGSTIAGALRSANAHYANMLLAFYLATGQDAANIVEGSQGFTWAEVRGEGDLYFSCTLPHLIVGTVGNGKDLPAVDDALARLGCRDERPSGENARRLAGLIAATVLCGELSLLAAQTNPGELMQSHLLLERRKDSTK